VRWTLGILWHFLAFSWLQVFSVSKQSPRPTTYQYPVKIARGLRKPLARQCKDRKEIQMSVNIACSAPDCTNPVIGQCQGYKKACGRYYCREHSVDALCTDCANRKAVDDLYQDYLSTAEGLEHEARSTITYKGLWVKGAKIAAIIGFFGGPIVFPFVNNPQNFASAVGFFFLGFIVGPIFMEILLIHPMLGLLIVWIVCASKRGNWHKTIGIERAKEINATKPGFFEFYTTWRQEKSREKLTTILSIAGAIAVAGLAAAASESEYDRTRRAVRDEMNRN
jgi:hypothetical protein